MLCDFVYSDIYDAVELSINQALEIKRIPNTSDWNFSWDKRSSANTRDIRCKTISYSFLLNWVFNKIFLLLIKKTGFTWEAINKFLWIWQNLIFFISFNPSCKTKSCLKMSNMLLSNCVDFISWSFLWGRYIRR